MCSVIADSTEYGVMSVGQIEDGFDLILRPERLEQPLRWRQRQLIFANSMSDLFHKDIPTEYIARVFDTMERADWHIYQVLTKRSAVPRCLPAIGPWARETLMC